MSVFDYPYTCPEIDRNIEHVKGEIFNHINDITVELVPYGDASHDSLLTNYIKSSSESLFAAVCYYIEEIRKTNQDMRESAEKQIEELMKELENASCIIDDLQTEIYTLENEQ